MRHGRQVGKPESQPKGVVGKREAALIASVSPQACPEAGSGKMFITVLGT